MTAPEPSNVDITDDLVLWLRAQLDEDERVARAVAVRDWAADSAWLADMRDPLPSQRHERAAGWQPMMTSEDAAHIARHDPARVLREVEAKRRIMEIHCAVPFSYLPAVCDGCGYEGICDDPVVEDINDCPILRLLASVYADRPGYQESWRPG